MRAPQAFWAGLFAAGAAVEAYGLSHPARRRWTLSRFARAVLRCDTRPGKAATTLLIGAGATALSQHLLNIPPQEES